jgi:hypothetical protein
MMRITDDQEVAHTVAALRYCQANKIDLSTMPQLKDEGHEPLNDAELDSLCYWLDTAT